ncbi:hypothetical protein HanRHA438_Chr16g0784431 [Helianthus annuus]|nr:hypothetical protein HanHA300_Chr16g0630881 [Helianthus annuus]KAJ0462316.1 hypothetical protein HanHA89_Chr16g0682081 [Helianthus annuus]KAJ0642721.1 hypothetical protein HanLR1_Chr16g0641511 [Helianthus annuus]KAJ0646593.1 hypothetical protein HanOQP8_Chr16g0636921 [Helianthus annuus]KAJ0823314.1 hypothetical protein HanPSC8_Chr16g0742301 [Helianthus annuus]
MQRVTLMVEMSALNHLMSTHVLQQAQQIEYLYDQAVEATICFSHIVMTFVLASVTLCRYVIFIG